MIPPVIERCAGVDVGRRFVVVCVMAEAARQTLQTERVRCRVALGELFGSLYDGLA